MNFSVVSKVLGVLLIFFSGIMVPPALVSLFYKDGEILTFVSSFAAIFLSGLALFLPFIKKTV